jgi:uncharacterized protein (TIGR03437 family)
MHSRLLACSLAIGLSSSSMPAQTPTITSVVPAALLGGIQFDLPCAPVFTPGMVVAVSGTNLAPESILATFGDKRAANISGGGTNYVYVQVPTDAESGTTNLLIVSLGLRSAAFPVRLDSYAPCLITNGPNVYPINRAAPVIPGQLLTVNAIGLGPVTATVVTGEGSPADALVKSAPEVRLDGSPVAVLDARLIEGAKGIYSVGFIVPPNSLEKDYPVSLSASGKTSNTGILAVGKSRPWIGSIVNAASYKPFGYAAPGTYMSIFGANFGTGNSTSSYPRPDFISVRVNKGEISQKNITLVSPDQINIILSDIPGGSVKTSVSTSFGASDVYELSVAGAAPGIFRIFDPSNSKLQYAAAVLANTAWLAIPTSVASALGIATSCDPARLDVTSSCGQPVAPGDVIQVYVTGLGYAVGSKGGSLPQGTEVAPIDGSVLYRTSRTPQVSVGGVIADVLFSGLVPGYAALYQINFRIPASVPDGDNIPLTVVSIYTDTTNIAIRSKKL